MAALRRRFMSPHARRTLTPGGALASRRLRLVAAMALALGSSACGGVLAEGVAQFDAGQYPAAKQIFASSEAEASRWALPRRAEYALYRGLTLDALGDETPAAVWLRRAAAIETAHPGALSPVDLRRLELVASVLSDGTIEPILVRGAMP
jgi:hypothetical protein